MGITLYDLTVEQQNINALLEENCGELTPELEQAMAFTRENFETKAEGYCKAIAMYKTEAAGLDAEIKRLQAKKKTAENAVERMRSSLADAMKVFDVSKMKAGTFSISRRDTEAVEIVEIDDVPAKYKESVTTIKVDKNAIKSDVDAGLVVEGVEIKKNTSITIR